MSFGFIERCPKYTGVKIEIKKKIFATLDPKNNLTTFFKPIIPVMPTTKLMT